MASDRRCSVFLVVPNDIFRSGCRALFTADPGFEVVGDAATILDLPQGEAAASIDVIVLDASPFEVEADRPDTSPVHVLRAAAPAASILVITDHADGDFTLRVIEAGAQALLLKPELSGPSLIEVARLIATADPSVVDTGLLLELLRRPDPVIYQHPGPAIQLTNRESEILNLLADGLSDQEIARVLGVARTTIHSHISALSRKLPATNRVQLGIMALRLGLLDLAVERP